MKTGLTIILDVAGWALILLSIAFAFITMLFFPAEKYTLEQLLFASINVLLGGVIIGSALLVISNTNKTLHQWIKNNDVIEGFLSPPLDAKLKAKLQDIIDN